MFPLAQGGTALAWRFAWIDDEPYTPTVLSAVYEMGYPTTELSVVSISPLPARGAVSPPCSKLEHSRRDSTQYACHRASIVEGAGTPLLDQENRVNCEEPRVLYGGECHSVVQAPVKGLPLAALGRRDDATIQSRDSAPSCKSHDGPMGSRVTVATALPRESCKQARPGRSKLPKKPTVVDTKKTRTRRQRKKPLCSLVPGQQTLDQFKFCKSRSTATTVGQA